MPDVWCTKCGNPSTTVHPRHTDISPTGKPMDPGRFTRIDQRGRYDLGFCKCTPGGKVIVLEDQIQAELLAAEYGRRHSADIQ